MSNGPSCHMGKQLNKKLSSSLTGQFFPKWFLPATHRLWTSEHPFFFKWTGFWCHLTFNNVVKMISNLTLPIVGESVIGWGIVSSIMIPPPYPLYILRGTSRTYIYPYNRFHASSTMAFHTAWHSLL